MSALPATETRLPPRGEKRTAPKDQLVTFIVVPKPHHHATYGEANQERTYLQAQENTKKHGKRRDFRVMKILNVSGSELAGKTVIVLDPAHLDSFALEEAGRVWERGERNAALRRGEMVEAIADALPDGNHELAEIALDALASLPKGGDTRSRAQEAIRTFLMLTTVAGIEPSPWPSLEIAEGQLDENALIVACAVWAQLHKGDARKLTQEDHDQIVQTIAAYLEELRPS